MTSPRIVARRKVVKELREAGHTQAAIARKLGVSDISISGDCKALGISPKNRPRGNVDKAALKRAASIAKGVRKVSDRRRFKVGAVPLGEPSRVVDPAMTGTKFPGKVSAVTDAEPVLKDGRTNGKIGGDVLVGHLKGARIFTLTLEERATCPRSCKMWTGCYGNAMQWAKRWKHGPALVDALRREVADVCAQNETVLIRLHILGDFYSVDYVKVWADLLDLHDNLYVFGFTAHGDDTPIGRAIVYLRERAPQHFAVRTSGRTGEWGSFTLPFPTEAKRIGDAVVCPEQRDAMEGSPDARHCGNCAVCWSSSVPIAFVEH